MKGWLEKLLWLFRTEQDPLDDMLREKGMDPEKVVRDARTRREDLGYDDPVNRMRDRNEKSRAYDRKTIDNNRGVR